MKYTVLGVWVEDEPVAVATIAGNPDVWMADGLDDGSDLIDGAKGTWCETVQANSAEQAEGQGITQILEAQFGDEEEEDA
jgi:hypothetical protein